MILLHGFSGDLSIRAQPNVLLKRYVLNLRLGVAPPASSELKLEINNFLINGGSDWLESEHKYNLPLPSSADGYFFAT